MYYIEIGQILTLLIDCGDLRIFIINKTELTSTGRSPDSEGELVLVLLRLTAELRARKSFAKKILQ